MDLYLLRHGEAGQAPRDEDRELTERGHEQARAVAAGLTWLNPGLDAILTSPLPRAVQTAQPVARALGLEVQTADALSPGHGPHEPLALLPGRGARVLLVGHEPQMSGLALYVTGGRVHMRTAMLAHLELDAAETAGGQLAALLSWQHLQRLGR
jgi:phosphohistidine phosphatase